MKPVLDPLESVCVWSEKKLIWLLPSHSPCPRFSLRRSLLLLWKEKDRKVVDDPNLAIIRDWIKR